MKIKLRTKKVCILFAYFVDAALERKNILLLQI